MPTQEQTESLPPDSAGAIQSADELQDGDRVVYPKQGVCRVIGRQAKEISGMQLEFVALAREEDSASILVPVAKVASIGLRKVADNSELADVFDLLASSFDDPELDWKVRHRLHGDLLAAGGILGIAEVLKALQALGNMRPLPQKERERYDAARHLLVDELAVALGVPPATAEDYIDFALIPPPGVVRPAARPRRLATLPARPARSLSRLRPSVHADEELEELAFDEEELGLEDEELPAEGEGAEEEAAEAEGEPEEEEEAPKKAGKAKAPAARKAAPRSAAKSTRAKKTAAEGEEKPKRATKKKAAEGAEKPRRAAAEGKPKRAAAKKAADGEEKAPARRSRTKKAEEP